MPTPDEQVIQDGQRAVAVTEVSGDFIYDGGATDAYCIVNNNGTAQRALKVANVGEGGGGGDVPDLSSYLQNKTTANNSLLLSLKEPDSATGTNSVTITNSTATSINQSGSYSVSIGNGYSINNSIVSIGYSASASDDYCIAIGRNSSGSGGTGAGKSATAIGNYALALGGTAIGAGTRAYGKAIALGVGNGTSSTDRVKAEGRKSIAIGVIGATGELCEATAQESIQLGNGANDNAKTLQVYEYPLLDGNTGKIPMARLPIVQITQADYDALVSGGTVDANTIYCIIPA